MSSRRQFISLVALMAVPAVAAEAAAVREFSFILARFYYLLLTTDNAGYRLCVVSDDKDGEVMRTSFSGFKLKSETKDHVTFESRYEPSYSDAKPRFISLDLQYDKDPGERTNRNINYGHWEMTIRGNGERYERLKKYLLENRIDELWTPRDSMKFRGATTAEHEWDADFLHR
jgi:hypothetical protein